MPSGLNQVQVFNMLIEFSVANFRSIREKQTFSMVAAPRLRKTENTFLPKVTGERLPRLLKVAAIYGPNASGKSNLTMAFAVLSSIVGGKRAGENGKLPVSPFRFDQSLADAPSEFEVHFVCNKTRYEYALSVTRDRIVYERLTAYPKGRESQLYERRHGANGDEYEFGPSFESEEFLRNAWKKLTGPQLAFIKQVAENSSEEESQLSAPYMWLRRGMSSIGTDLKGFSRSSRELAYEKPHLAEEIAQFLQQIDVPVSKIQFEAEQSQNDSSLTEERDSSPKIKKTTLTHFTALGEAEFDYSEESEGTKALIGFWLPWGVLSEGELGLSTLIVDELDSSLHPMIVAELVAQHISNNSPSQLIFTTHDTHLMDTKLLRRDQIWVTERDRNGATQVRSVHDFEGRESEDIEKRYYEGRYRGLPFVRRRGG